MSTGLGIAIFGVWYCVGQALRSDSVGNKGAWVFLLIAFLMTAFFIRFGGA